TFIEIQDENDLYPDGNGDSFGTSPGMNSEKVVEPNFENNDLGIFGGFNIDLVKLLKIKDVLNPSERKSNKNAAFSVSYDARKGIIKVTAGYAYNKFFKNDDDKARYDKAKKALSDYRAESVELHNEIDRLQTELQENDKRLQELQSRQNASQAEINRYKNQIKGFQQRIVEIKEEGKKSSSYLRSQCTQRRIEIDKVATSMRQRDKHVQELINQTNSGKQSVNDMKRRLDAIPDLIREVKNEYAQNQRRFTIDVDVLGVFEYNPKEKSVSNFAVNATLTLNFKFKGTFFAGYIPMFYEVAVNLEFGIEVEFYAENGVWITWDSFLERMLLYGSVTLRGEVGAGVNDVTNISLFAQAMIKLSIYAFAKNNIDEMYIINLKDNLGLEFDWKIGLRVELFLWYFEFVGYGGSLGKDPTLPVSLDPNFQNLMVSAKLSNRYTENTSIAENEVFTSVYNGSKSKLIALDDGRYILTWIEDSYLRDEYNRTILKYAIFNNGVWSQSKAVFDDGRADFYHDTYLVGNNLYVAWQKSNSLFNSDDNYITVGSASEIYTARIDTNSDTVFDVIRQTNNSDLDFAPRFVQREIASEPLAIVWQKNSQNDILGLSGENSIYYKQLIGSAANVIYQTERGISHLAAAFKNGIIAVAFSEDYGCEIVEDESYSPIRLGKIVYGKTTSTIDANGVFGTQFLLRDGEMTLFIHDGKTIIFTDDFVNLYQFSGLADYIVSSSFSIIETATGIAVFYDKMGIDGQQAYVSMFNSESREWTYDIVLSAQDNVRFFNVSGIIDSDGDIWASYNAQNEDMATVLCFSSITPQSDFEIGLTYIDFLENDEISLTIGLRNIGTSNIFKFTVVAFGETHDIYLDNPLRIAEYD
ncbi:MAG: hypothetical protein LBU04_01315, partial [Christensenellaceae bacterium]|nr:hypothetical protein [Christensenellaceae bacterium]